MKILTSNTSAVLFYFFNAQNSFTLEVTVCAYVRELPAIGQRWFEFNDMMVQPITEDHITKMFQGKQSAYMLFYRRQRLSRPSEGD